MTVTAMRTRLMEWVQTAPGKELEVLLQLIAQEELLSAEAAGLSHAQWQELAERRTRFAAGKEQITNWETVHERIRKKSKKRA